MALAGQPGGHVVNVPVCPPSFGADNSDRSENGARHKRRDEEHVVETQRRRGAMVGAQPEPGAEYERHCRLQGAGVRDKPGAPFGMVIGRRPARHHGRRGIMEILEIAGHARAVDASARSGLDSAPSTTSSEI